MRGTGIISGNYGKPRATVGQSQANNIPLNQTQQEQQHMMMLQQQFIAQQQIIQIEQLQKQRKLRQEEEKRASLFTAIRDLQLKTVQEKLHKPPQFYSPNLPLHGHLHLRPGLTPYTTQTTGSPVKPNSINYGESWKCSTNKTYSNTCFISSNSRNTSVPQQYSNNLVFPKINNLHSFRLATPQSKHNCPSNYFLNSCVPQFNSTQHRPQINTGEGNVNTTFSNITLDQKNQGEILFGKPLELDAAGNAMNSASSTYKNKLVNKTIHSEQNINQKSDFDQSLNQSFQSRRPPTLKSTLGQSVNQMIQIRQPVNQIVQFGQSVSQAFQFGQSVSHASQCRKFAGPSNISHLASSDCMSGPVGTNNTKPTTLEIPVKNEVLSLTSMNMNYPNCFSSYQNSSLSPGTLSRDHANDNIQSKQSPERNTFMAFSSGTCHRNQRPEEKVKEYSSSPNIESGRGTCKTEQRGTSRKQDTFSERTRDRILIINPDWDIDRRSTDRWTYKNQDKDSKRNESRSLSDSIHIGRRSNRSNERSKDRRPRDESRHCESKILDRTRTPEHKSERHGSCLGLEHSSSYSENRSRAYLLPQDRSLSASRNSRFAPYVSYSQNRSASRRQSPQFKIDSSRGKRKRTDKRSQSPSQISDHTPAFNGGQLSQYRQDLLNSEQHCREQSHMSPKQRKLNSDFDDDFSFYKDEKPEAENACYFTRSCPADLFFSKHSETGDMESTARMVELEDKFEEEIVLRAEKVRARQLPVDDPPMHNPTYHHHHDCLGHSTSSCDSSSFSSSDDDDEGSGSQIMEEWDRRKKHPYSLHPELWFNLKGQANDGPLCQCSIKSRQSGIRHEVYPGEKYIDPCKDESSNLSRLYHYRITVSPYTNFLTKVPTLINHDNHEYIFEGFSMFSHIKLENIPPCRLLRFNIEYTIHFIPENAPENFTVRSLNLFNRFIFTEILELIDMNWTGPFGGCQHFHLMPRFCRTLPDSGCKEVLSMNTVLSFLLKSVKQLVDETRLEEIMQCVENEWHSKVDNLRGMIVTNPGMKPSSIRIDQLDRKVTTPVVRTEDVQDSSDVKNKGEASGDNAIKKEKLEEDSKPKYPLIIHQGYRPAQLSYAGDPVYRKAWKQYVKFRHLLNSKPKIVAADKLKLKEQEEKLREIRMKKTMKREITVEISSKGFLCTGLRADLCQHALMMPVLMSHLRFHICLDVLEDTLGYKFQDRNLLQLALTHTSYRTNYGTNPDHTRNSLTNCGMRQVEYGDRRIHYQNTRKRGICILVDIMSRFGKQEETASDIPHNERLEFLGDAVIEFLTSVHLFYMFPWLEEGGLTTYRMALVQNQHLAVLAKKLKLQDFMLYVHGPDLCHESDLRHAMANCCEAIIGALFLDGGIEVADTIFSKTLFDDEDVLLRTWTDLPRHVLQQEEPGGDRHWITSSPILQKMKKFENMIGIKFNHIRLLAKAFTHRNIGINPLTLGHNQRLEFLGDTVLQLIASEYLYKHYPEHHEGHLSLLRSSLVNSRTQGLVYDDLGMSEFVICNENTINDGLDMKTKQRADILESFVGALFVDKDLDYCRAFCNVCFFPRLKDFIMNQDWNDPKSQLQQCCLTLREVGGGEPDIPVYKVIKSIGPTNTRKYVVAVYFRGRRLARGTGHSIQQAEMAAATQALKKRAELFPILQHQRRFLERMKKEESEHGIDLDDLHSSKKHKQFRTHKRLHKSVRSKTN